MATEKYGIELELIGYEGVYSNAKRLEQTLANLSKMRFRLQFDTELRRLETEIRRLQTKKTSLINSGATKEELDKVNKEINTTRTNLLNLKQMGKNAIFTDQSWERYFNRMQAKIVQVGARMQTLGKTLQTVTSPFTRFFSGMIMGAGYAALNKITSGFSGMFERYDTMMNYSRALEALGFKSKDAQKSVEKLNEAVLGLPTGLDEIVAAQKVYVGATGDLAKATNIAIAANNTFLASGTQSREQRFIQKYLSALGSGAELTATQWASMSRIAPLAMRAVAKELGYADDKYKEFNTDLQKGNIESEKFLDAFIKIGTSGVVADAANVMKMSWEGLSANLGNATKRMGEAALKALDEVFKGYNGRTLLQNLLGVDAKGNSMGDGIKDWINNMSKELQDWIKANPEKIIDFFKTLKSMDVAGFLKGLAEASMNVLEIFKQLAPLFGSNLGKFAIYGNLIGKALLLFGGFTKGSAGIVKNILKFFAKGGIFGSLFGVFGKLGRGIGGLFKGGGAGAALESAGSLGKSVAVMAGGWAGVASKALTIAAIPAIAFSVKIAVEALKELADVNMNWDRFKQNVEQLALLVGSFTLLAGAIGLLGAIPGAKLIVGFGTGILVGISVAIEELAKAMKSLNEMVIPTPETISKKVQDIKKIIKPMQDMLDLFSEGGFFKNIAKVAENFSASWVIKSITKVVDAAVAVTDKANELAALEVDPDLADKIADVGHNFVPVAINLQQILTALSEDGVFANIHQLLQNWTGNAVIESVGNAAIKIKGFYKALKSIGKDKFDQSIIDNANEWLGGFEELINSHYVTINAWNNKHMNADISAYVETMTSLGEAFGMYQIILEHFDNIVSTFNKYSNGGTFLSNGDPFGNVRNRFAIITKFVEELVGEDGSLRRLQQLGGGLTTTGLTNIASTIETVKGIFINLGGLADQIAKNSLFADNGDMGSGIGGLRHALGWIVPELNEVIFSLKSIDSDYDLAGKVDAINNGLDKMSEMFSKIRLLAYDVQGGIFSEIQTIKAALVETSALGQNMVNVRFVLNFIVDPGASIEITEGIIASYINSVLVYAEMFDATVTKKIEVNLTCTVNDWQRCIDKIANVRRAIMQAVDSLNITRTRRVTVNLETRTNGGGELYPHTGGYVTRNGLLYRAGGGQIFKPRGTDIVPAMLTPGEWVIKNKAVRKFGAEFMDRVNHLDIDGAIRALHSRVGGTMAASRKMVVNNNTTDNRSYSNVQNITTNNPNFAFRRSRWVSELR